jgi:hypothetical protein
VPAIPAAAKLIALTAYFRDLGGEPTPTIDPPEIVPAPIKHRITIEARDEPLPPTNGATIVEAINGLVAALAPRKRAEPILAPARAATEIAAPTARPQPVTLFRRDEHGPRIAANYLA